MGFNQISRLYYCFSQSQVHSTKGYPNWLFFLVIFVGCYLVITVAVFPWLWVDVLCRHQDDNQNYDYIAPATRDDAPTMSTWIKWRNITMVVYLSWDLTTSFLYVYKVLSFRKYKEQNENIHHRIMFILKQVVILTNFL